MAHPLSHALLAPLPGEVGPRWTADPMSTAPEASDGCPCHRPVISGKMIFDVRG
jgi:hypothetical protein